MGDEAHAHKAHAATKESAPAEESVCDNCEPTGPSIDCCAHDQLRMEVTPLLAERVSVTAMHRAAWGPPVALALARRADRPSSDPYLSAVPASQFSVLRL